MLLIMPRISSILLFYIFALGLSYSQSPEPDFTEMKCTHNHMAHLKSISFIERESYYDYDLIYNKIHWKVNPEKRYIQGKVSFLFKALKNEISSIQLDLHDSLHIDSITRNSVNLPYAHRNHSITVALPTSLSINKIDSFTLYYHGIPPNTGSGAFETILRDSVYPELWTLSEPYGALEWWPCKQSLLDKIDSIDICITIPEKYKAASNGLLISEEIEGNQNISHWKHRYPITTYLVGIAVTNYKEFSEYFFFSDTDSMLLINRVFPEYFDQAKKGTEMTPKFMRLFSDLFIPYPFKNEWYGHAQFSRGGGMEHQTMSFMANFGFELVAHELAHQWFGNYATLNSWHDIWLNEGFATYLTGLAYENLDPYWFHRFYEVRLEGIVKKPDGSVYVQDTTDANRIFNGRLSYAKGAYVLRMLRWELGDADFFSALRNYMNDERLKYGYTSQQILVDHLETAGDTSLTEFFNDWYYGEGNPNYQVLWDQKNDSVYIAIQQQTSHESVDFYEMHIPLKIVTRNDTVDLRLHHTLNGQEYVFAMQQNVQEILFDPDIWLLSTNHVITDYDKVLISKNVTLYPNPATDWLHIDFPNFMAESGYEIYTISGKKIRSGNLQKEQNLLKIAGMKPGIYLLKIQLDNGYVTKQFNIQR